MYIILVMKVKDKEIFKTVFYLNEQKNLLVKQIKSSCLLVGCYVALQILLHHTGYFKLNWEGNEIFGQIWILNILLWGLEVSEIITQRSRLVMEFDQAPFWSTSIPLLDPWYTWCNNSIRFLFWSNYKIMIRTFGDLMMNKMIKLPEGLVQYYFSILI